MSNKNFTHLHVHTTFSLLDGISKRDELINLTKAYGMPGMAITEHGNLFNCISFYREATKAGIVPIIGYEAYVAPDSRFDRTYAKKGEAEEDAKNGDLTLYAYHLTVLAKNRTGYENLKTLSTLAYKEGFYRKPRIDDEILDKHKDGLIVLSGCLASKIARLIVAGNKNAAMVEIDKLRFRHGENFYLELMAHNIDEEGIVREALIDVSKKHGIPTVMTGDSHFTHHGDELAHTVALNMGTDRTLSSDNKWTFNGEGYWYKKPEEMWKIADEANIPDEALTNTVNICKSIEDYGFKLASKTKKFVVPLFREDNHIYTDEECHQLLEFRTWQGLAERGLTDSPVHRARVIEELTMMKNKNFSSYFLIIADIVDFMRRENIIAPIGRGSSVGSLVCYCLFIIGLDPIEHGVPFERFINEGRKDLPDVDTDISQENRGKVLQYIANKYGHDKVAHIVTFQSLRPKAAIDNVGRVLDIPAAMRRQATADIHDDPTSSDTLSDIIKTTPTAAEIINSVDNWLDIAIKLEGNNKNLGSHAAGIVISNESLLDSGVPLLRDAEDGLSTTQLDMDDVSELGLLKLDMLGLKNMDVISRTLAQIKKRYGHDIDWHRIPLDDQATYKTIASGKYVSIFQYDSAGMRSLAKQLKPENFDHLVAINCLYRPGPMKKPSDGGQSILEMYLDRRHGKAPIEYWHPELEPVFSNTLGLCIEENQLVTRSDGSKVKIKDVGVGDSLLSINSSSNTVARKTFTGTKECVKINTKYGASLICSIDHPIMVNMKQIAAGDIKVGDFVHKPYITLPMNECDLTEDQAYCIGLLLGDGSINASTPTIALGNDQTWHDQVETSFTSAWPEILPHKYHNCRSFYFSLGMAANRADESNVANVISRCLTDLGIRQSTCKNKFIPDKIKYSNDKTRLATLAGLWDSDGTVSSTVCYTSASKSLIRDVDEILSHLRISHYIGKHQNRIYIRDVSKFMEIVPLRHHAKIKAGTMNARYLRVSRSHLIADMASSGLKKRQYARKLKISRSSISKASLDKYCTVHLSNKFDAGIKKFYYDDHDSDIVTSIESVGRRSVYDLTMTDSSRPWFTAGDILVHNCLFQEQLMGLAKVMSGFNNVEADEYRAAVGKKDREKFIAAQDKLIQRGIDMGRPASFMKELADKVSGFARYGWNIGHSKAYSYISYVTAWLETHYQCEYYTSLLNTADDDTKKLAVLISMILQRNIKLSTPDVNKSIDEFSTDGKKIYMGLYSIRKLGEGSVPTIIADRAENGEYKDFMDFMIRMRKFPLVNRSVKENLIKAGAFNWDQTWTIKDKISNLEKIQDCLKKYHDKLGLEATKAKIEEKILISKQEFQQSQLLELEKSVLNFYISSHPALHFCRIFRLFPSVNFILPAQLQSQDPKASVLVAGVVTSKNVKPTSTGSQYLELTISDNISNLKLRIWAPYGPTIAPQIVVGQMAIVCGTAIEDKFLPSEMSMKVTKVIPIVAGTGMPIKEIISSSESKVNQAATTIGAVIGAHKKISDRICMGVLASKAYIRPEHVDSLSTINVTYVLDF